MADPLDTTDAYGLATLARRWTPASMRNGEGAQELMDTLADGTADALNILMMLESYVPIIWHPSRCDDRDLDRVLHMNGISTDRTATALQKRRLAVLASDLRAWRGAFLSLRAVVQAFTGGAVVIRSWLVQRVVVDESSWDLVLLSPADHSDETDVFLLGVGPNSEYDAVQVDTYVDDLAKTVLDVINYLPCYVVTSWRDGLANWTATGTPVLIASTELNEYEAIEIGPVPDPTVAVQFIEASTLSESGSSEQCLRLTIFAETLDATDDDFWEAWMFATENSYLLSTGHDGYLFRIHVGNARQIQMYRVVGGALTLIGAHAFNLQNGTDWRRIDLQVDKTTSTTKCRAYVDGNPGFIFNDPGSVGSRPNGQYTYLGLRATQFTTGKLRIAAVLGQQLSS